MNFREPLKKETVPFSSRNREMKLMHMKSLESYSLTENVVLPKLTGGRRKEENK